MTFSCLFKCLLLKKKKNKRRGSTTLHAAQTNRKEQRDASCPPVPFQPGLADNRWPSLPQYRAAADANRRGDKHSAGVRPRASDTACVCVSVCLRVCVCVWQDGGQRASFLRGEESVIDSRGRPAGRKCRHMLNGWAGTRWHKLLGQMHFKSTSLIMKPRRMPGRFSRVCRDVFYLTHAHFCHFINETVEGGASRKMTKINLEFVRNE